MLTNMIFRIAFAAALTAFASPATAIWMSKNGATATLRGAIADGDDDAFRAFLAQPRPQPIRALYLNSSGGRVNAAIEIARQVREARLATVVDAASAACDSACTYTFVAGVRRHYLNSDTVQDGISGGRAGLGFHPPHKKSGTVRTPPTLHEGSADRVLRHFTRMGTPAAVEMMDRAAFNSLFRIGGQTALNSRIATSLAPPLIVSFGAGGLSVSGSPCQPESVF